MVSETFLFARADLYVNSQPPLWCCPSSAQRIPIYSLHCHTGVMTEIMVPVYPSWYLNYKSKWYHFAWGQIMYSLNSHDGVMTASLSFMMSWWQITWYHFTWGQRLYSLHCNNVVMTTSFVKYPVAHLSDKVLELVCNLSHLIIIIIISTFHELKKKCIFCLCQVVMTETSSGNVTLINVNLS